MNGSGLRVLIFEDDPLDIQLNINELKKGFQKTEIKSTAKEKDFKRLIDEFDPHVILSDYNLPGFNGKDALEYVSSQYPLLPIIIVTGSLDEETAASCIKMGAWDYLLKDHIFRLNPAIKLALEHQEKKQNLVKAEQELSISRSQYQAIFDSVNDGIFIYEPGHFKLLDVNEAVLELYKYKKEELLRKSIGDLSDNQNGFTNAKAKEYAEKALKAKLDYVEWRARDKNNRIFWIGVSLKRLRFGNKLILMGIVRDIDAQRETEQSLLKSQEHFRALTENSPDVIMRFDKEFRHLFVNNSVEEMVGIPPEDFINKTHQEMGVFPNELCEFWELHLEKVFKEKESHTIEFSVPGPGKVVEIEWRIFPEFNESGEVEAVITVARDISDRIRQEKTQEVLIEIANAVSNTTNLSELFLQIQKSLGTIIDTRNCYVAMYDERTDTISLPFHQDEKDSFTEFPAGKTITGYVIKTGKYQLVDEKNVEELENQNIIEPIGTPSVSWLGVPLRMGDKIIGVFVVQSYSEDIRYTEEDAQLLEFTSDQIALAIRRKMDQDKLQENEARQRRIIESSPDGLAVIDMTGRIKDCNSTFMELLRLEPSECMDLSFFDLVADKDVIKVQNVLHETLITSYSKNFEFRLKRSNGSEFFSESSFGLISGSDDREGSFVIVIKNIEERKVYEENLKVAKERAEEADRLKTAFLSNMSHEIRTPMNAIIGFSELLTKSNYEQEERSEYVGQINGATDKLMRLIDDIIDISKIESGQLVMNPSIFPLKPVFTELGSYFSTQLKKLKKGDIKLELVNEDLLASVQIHTDKFRLQQVLSNLLSNAIKFTDTGKISYGIKKAAEGEVVFFVKDTGVGISKEKQQYIFERFRQGHESRDNFYGGTGLGLSISSHLVELMGGKINLESEENEGAEFFFSLPYDNLEISLPDEKVKLDRSPDDWSEKTILVAEDDHSNFFLLQEFLKEYKINILRAVNGKEACKMVEANTKIDVILMDVQMPEMNGYEATQQIKSIKPNIPIIAQTAYAMAGEREASEKAGCDDYISKPLVINELIFILKKFLEN